MHGLEVLLAVWRAMESGLQRVEPTPWGAVITDSRFPIIWDVNYVRVDSPTRGPSLEEIERVATPPLKASGAESFHVVMFRPEETTTLLEQLSSRGDRLVWDVVMQRIEPGTQLAAASSTVEEIDASDDRFWTRFRSSLHEFDPVSPEVERLLQSLERDVFLGTGKRWFGVREAGELVSMGSLHLFSGAAYVDHVVTFAPARGKGHASAVVARIVDAAQLGGAEAVFLLADPDGPITLYERLGFREIGRLASTFAQMPSAQHRHDRAAGGRSADRRRRNVASPDEPAE
jgi:ribosomal protein S18 acetylase RimI-like enzyme